MEKAASSDPTADELATLSQLDEAEVARLLAPLVKEPPPVVAAAAGAETALAAQLAEIETAVQDLVQAQYGAGQPTRRLETTVDSIRGATRALSRGRDTMMYRAAQYAALGMKATNSESRAIRVQSELATALSQKAGLEEALEKATRAKEDAESANTELKKEVTRLAVQVRTHADSIGGQVGSLSDELRTMRAANEDASKRLEARIKELEAGKAEADAAVAKSTEELAAARKRTGELENAVRLADESAVTWKATETRLRRRLVARTAERDNLQAALEKAESERNRLLQQSTEREKRYSELDRQRQASDAKAANAAQRLEAAEKRHKEELGRAEAETRAVRQELDDIGKQFKTLKQRLGEVEELHRQALAKQKAAADKRLAEEEAQHGRALADQKAAAEQQLAEAVARHKEALGEVEAEKRAARQQVAELGERIADLRKALGEIEERHKQDLADQKAVADKRLAEEKARHNEDMAALQHTKDDLGSRVLAADETVKNLRAQNTKLTEDLGVARRVDPADMVVDADSARAELAAQRTALESGAAELRSYALALAGRDATLLASAVQMQQYIAEVRIQATATIADLEGRLATARETISSHIAERRQLQDKYEALVAGLVPEAALQLIKTQIAENAGRIATLNADIEEKAGAIRELQSKLDAEKSRAAEAATRAAVATSNAEQADAKIRVLESKAAASSEELVALRGRAAQRNAADLALGAEMQKVAKDVDALARRESVPVADSAVHQALKDLSQRSTFLEDVYRTVRADKNKLEQSRALQDAEIIRLEAEAAKAADKIFQQTAEIGLMKAQITAKTSDVVAAQRTATERDAHSAALSGSLDTAREGIEAMKARVSELEAGAQKTAIKLGKLRKRLDDNEEIRKKLETELRESEGRNDTLAGQLEQAQQEHDISTQGRDEMAAGLEDLVARLQIAGPFVERKRIIKSMAEENTDEEALPKDVADGYALYRKWVAAGMVAIESGTELPKEVPAPDGGVFTLSQLGVERVRRGADRTWEHTVNGVPRHRIGPVSAKAPWLITLADGSVYAWLRAESRAFNNADRVTPLTPTVAAVTTGNVIIIAVYKERKSGGVTEIVPYMATTRYANADATVVAHYVRGSYSYVMRSGRLPRVANLVVDLSNGKEEDTSHRDAFPPEEQIRNMLEFVDNLGAVSLVALGKPVGGTSSQPATAVSPIAPPKPAPPATPPGSQSEISDPGGPFDTSSISAPPSPLQTSPGGALAATAQTTAPVPEGTSKKHPRSEGRTGFTPNRQGVKTRSGQSAATPKGPVTPLRVVRQTGDQSAAPAPPAGGSSAAAATAPALPAGGSPAGRISGVVDRIDGALANYRMVPESMLQRIAAEVHEAGGPDIGIIRAAKLADGPIEMGRDLPSMAVTAFLEASDEVRALRRANGSAIYTIEVSPSRDSFSATLRVYQSNGGVISRTWKTGAFEKGVAKPHGASGAHWWAIPQATPKTPDHVYYTGAAKAYPIGPDFVVWMDPFGVRSRQVTKRETDKREYTALVVDRDSQVSAKTSTLHIVCSIGIKDATAPTGYTYSVVFHITPCPTLFVAKTAGELCTAVELGNRAQ